MNWTDKQLQAITERDKNILVSAAAGSGKTAVLVERILRLIIEDNVDVDRILVVTFTKAAASEMKGKIVKAIKKEMSNNPQNAAVLRKQLEKMPLASISTFHSFALNLIKRYFYIIDINPNLKIADETQTVVMKDRAIDKVFETFFEENDESFIEFLKCYSSHKTEDKIKESLLSIYEKIMAMTNPFGWLQDSVKSIEGYRDYKTTKVFEYVKRDIAKNLREAVTIKSEMIQILDGVNAAKMAASQSMDLEYIKEVMAKADEEDYETVRSLLNDFKPKQLRPAGTEKDDYAIVKELIMAKNNKFKDKIKELKENYFSDTIENIFGEVCGTHEHMQTLEKILLAFDREYRLAKDDKKIMDFNDVEHFAIDILKNEEVAQECRNKFRYIFIDEYQDSNFLQEEIINKVKREDNLFMVGDIKQSIYRFRLAEPDIFKDKYQAYAQNQINSTKIDLNQNFRSKGLVIDAINGIFEKIMSGYDENAALYQGAKSKEGYDFPVEMVLIEEAAEELEDETLADMKKAEIEALATVKKIKEIVGKKYYDHKNDEVKELSYRDIVILMRSLNKWGETFKEVFEKNDIPVFLNSDSGYFDTVEIKLMTDLLDVIDNSSQDIPLLGVLKSRVFDYSVDELIEIRLIDKKIPYNRALKLYAQEGSDEALKEKCKGTLNKLREWKELSRYTDIESFVWEVMKESGIYFYAATMQGGKQRQLNLRTFLDKTADYSKFGDNSIYGLLRYFDRVKKKVDVGQASLASEEDDTVQITTIHKSKGLEYPVVILPRLSSRFNKDNEADIELHKDFGIGLSNVDLEKKVTKRTVLQNVIHMKKDEENLEEELRILYVAMTRAKDKLILMANVKNIEEYKGKVATDMISKGCFLDYIYPNMPKSCTREIHMDTMNLTQFIKEEGHTSSNRAIMQSFINKANESDELSSEVSRILDYRYPYQKEMETKSKYSVSELNNKEIYGYINRVKTPVFEKREGKIKGAALGTVYHTIMEHIDFEKALSHSTKYIEDKIKTMTDEEIITAKEADAVDVQKIDGFFKSDIGIRAAKNKSVKEQTFTMIYNKEGIDTMVQGIIDCYFEEDGELVLVDYKTNYITEGIEELYKDQLSLYKEALEKATDKKVKESWLYLFEKNEGIKLI